MLKERGKDEPVELPSLDASLWTRYLLLDMFISSKVVASMVLVGRGVVLRLLSMDLYETAFRRNG